MGEEAEQTLDSLQKSAKEINSELRLMELNGEKGSDAWKEMKNLQKELNAEIKEMAHNLDLNDASMNELTANSRQLNRELANLKIGSDEWIDKLKEISQVDEKIAETRAEMKRLKNEGEEQDGFWTSFKANFAAAFTVDAVMGAASAIWEFGKEIFETSAKFEKYEAVLKNALGTQEAATKAMEDIKTIAATTPFSVDELTESYVKYVNRGLQPTMDEMTKLGDIAASQGKSFDQLTEAVLDATTGEFERLKEFGIQAKKNGEEVELSFKGIQKTIANTPEAIQEALLSFGELEGVAGSMAAISQTLGGRLSNLGDNFDSLKIILGDALKPVFVALMDAFNTGIEIIKGIIENSQPIVIVFESIAEVIGSLWQSFRQLIETFVDFSNSSVTLRDVMGAIGLVINAVTIPFRALIAIVTTAIDGFNVLVNKGREVLNFFGGDFKINPQATFDNMLANAEKNFKGIGASWTKNVAEVQIGKIKDVEDKAIASENTKYLAEKKRIETTFKDASARATELEKLEKTHVASLNKAKADAIKEEGKERKKYILENIKDEKERDKQLNNLALSTRNSLRELAVKSDDDVAKHKVANQNKVSDEAKKAAEKEATDRKKANDEANKYIEDKNVTLIKNDLDRAIAAENLKYTREKERIDKSKADATLKAQQIETLEQTHQAALNKIRDDQATKDKKRDDDEAKRKETEAKKQAADEKAARDNKLKEEKILLDAGFMAEIEKAKLSLSLTTNTAKAQYDAKVQLLEAESKYKAAKLQAEANAEKQRVTESIADETRRAAAHKQIDDTLKSQLEQNENKLKADRIAAQKATDEARKQSNEEFMGWLKKAQDGDFKGFTSYLADKIKSEKENLKGRDQENVTFFGAMKAAMKGDFQTFTTFLAQKTKDESVFNKKSFQDFSDKTEAVGKVATMGIQALQALNKAYLEKQQANITKEKDSQLKAWKEKYDKGLVSKDEYEKNVAKINKEADDKTKQVQKEAFERDKKLQIAMALVAGALAFIKALASGFFPVNLVMAAATAVATGLQVAMIKRQQFQGAKGGTYVKNAGVVQGGLHGAQYGQGGISMIDRKTGQEVGEIEGEEPVMILSRNTYRNNKPVVDKLLHSSLHKNGAPIMKNGGIVTLRQAGMYQQGGVYEEDGPTDSYYSSGSSGSSEESNSYDSGGSSSYGDSETGAAIDNSEAEARIAENTALQKEQLQLLKDIKEGIGMLASLLTEGNSERRGHTGLLNDIRNKPTGPSLHDIVSNIGGMIAANNKSNL